METTEWEKYGTGNYAKCSNCMVHSGYEATAVEDTLKHPLKAAIASLRGPKTEGPMAPDIPLDNARPAVYVFEKQVKSFVDEMHKQPEREKARSSAA